MKSLFGKSQPGRTSQRGLTYTLILRGIWAKCVVVQEYVFLRRGALYHFTHLEQIIKRAVHSFTRGACFERSGEESFLASSHSNSVSALEVREHLIL